MKEGKHFQISVAIVLGLAIGSFRPVLDLLNSRQEISPALQTTTAAVALERDGEAGKSLATASMAARPGTTQRPSASQQDDDPTIVVAVTDSLELMALVVDGEFVGYEVLKSGDDQRLRVGDVIVSINGESVEGSPAGSERLIIDLNRPDADIVVHPSSGGRED